VKSKDLSLPEISPEFAAQFRQDVAAAVAEYPHLELEWDTDLKARVHGPDPDGPELTLWPKAGNEVAAVALRILPDGWFWDHFRPDEIPDLIYTFYHDHAEAS
jgi:hypothetical protein